MRSRAGPKAARPARPARRTSFPGGETASDIAARVGPRRIGAILRNSQVAMAFEALGDRWSVLILRGVFLGARRFEELIASAGASRGTLTARLRFLVNEGILHRHRYQLRPVRYEYRLTRMGADLYPTVLMYWLWERRYGGGPDLPHELLHRTCGRSMQPRLVCRACHEPLAVGSISVETVAEPDERRGRPPKHCLHAGAGSWRGARSGNVRLIDVVGDRWTALVQASGFFGLHRFADIQAALLVPTNTLADRLRLLVQAGVFERIPYQSNPPRHSYRLTEKGRALYLPVLTMHQWADRWLLRGRTAPIRLWHRPCGSVANGAVVCDRCHIELRLSEVEPRWLPQVGRLRASSGRAAVDGTGSRALKSVQTSK